MVQLVKEWIHMDQMWDLLLSQLHQHDEHGATAAQGAERVSSSNQEVSGGYQDEKSTL